MRALEEERVVVGADVLDRMSLDAQEEMPNRPRTSKS